MNMNMNMNVIILDFETSGLNPYQDDIIEIGAKVMGTDNYYTTLVQPRSDKFISKKITEITGITNRLLKKEGKKWLEAYKDFYNWLMEQFKDGEENMIVSHNGETFDFLFFRKMLMCLQGENEDISKIKEYNIIYIDTLLLSRRLLSNRSYYTQKSLCNTFNIQIINAHRAMGDVVCLEELYGKLLTILGRDYDNITGKLVRDYIRINI